MTTNQQVTEAVAQFREAERMLQATSAAYRAARQVYEDTVNAVDLARKLHQAAADRLQAAATADIPATRPGESALAS